MAQKPFYPTPQSAAVSAVMRGNRSRDTMPEQAVRRLLHARGRRFRVCYRVSLPSASVRPDIVFPRQRLAVFIDGCFWHSCALHGTSPHANTRYWLPKLRRVVERDRRVDEQLREAGWVPLRIWEHVPPEMAASLVEQALRQE